LEKTYKLLNNIQKSDMIFLQKMFGKNCGWTKSRVCAIMEGEKGDKCRKNAYMQGNMQILQKNIYATKEEYPYEARQPYPRALHAAAFAHHFAHFDLVGGGSFDLISGRTGGGSRQSQPALSVLCGVHLVLGCHCSHWGIYLRTRRKEK
jgi:hypothetical protein